MATKQYGGWYWQPDQNKALRWWGTDSSGKDIYTTGDEPGKQQHQGPGNGLEQKTVIGKHG